VDDDAPITDEPWYGYVTDPEVDPDELTFVESTAIWAFTGFIAAGTAEIGAAPAVLFHTIAPKFVLAMRRGSAGEIIRVILDGEDAAAIDTSPYSPGDVIRVPFIADPSVTTGHDITLIGIS
jgi:hypothetical protein